jgi:uncharacterized transporter YbjL
MILRYQRPEDKLAKLTSLNFGEVETKMNYAKAKFALGSIAGIIYALCAGFMCLITKTTDKLEPEVDNVSKSFVLFLILSLLTLLRDKYEKPTPKKR